tara:strand:- start:163 stop:300 length:138 start_codon:yes stop_codon:yes gene_type:complete
MGLMDVMTTVTTILHTKLVVIIEEVAAQIHSRVVIRFHLVVDHII